MSRGNRLATSTTKTDVKADRKAFVTLRFAGDELDPREISAILPVKPTRAHKKGEEFFAGPNAGNLRGRTGIWFLATDKLVHSDDLRDHLAFVQRLLYPELGNKRRIATLQEILGAPIPVPASPVFGMVSREKSRRKSRLSSNQP